tara:strand:- start:252 stop:461 length:210 start_codon:yes stop_codon:yes gene_type:complete
MSPIPLLPVPITPILTVILGVFVNIEKGENLGVTTAAVSKGEVLEINFLLEFIKMFVLLKLKKTGKYPT